MKPIRAGRLPEIISSASDTRTHRIDQEVRVHLDIETVVNCNLCGSSDLIDIDRKSCIGLCCACGFIFDRERPTAREIEIYYSREGKYNDWLWMEKERDILWQRRLRIVLKYRQNGALLDVGTGIGQFLHFAEKHFDVSGTEVSASAVEIAKNKYNLNIMKGTLENLSFGNKFDVVSLYHVLEHVPDPSSVIRRCRDLLYPGGFLFVAVPNDVPVIRTRLARFLSMLNIPRFHRFGLMGFPKLVLDGSLPEIHLSHFTSPVLRRFLEKSGFEVIEDTLDQFYVEPGHGKLNNDLNYRICMAVNKILRINIYSTILMIARKTA